MKTARPIFTSVDCFGPEEISVLDSVIKRASEIVRSRGISLDQRHKDAIATYALTGAAAGEINFVRLVDKVVAQSLPAKSQAGASKCRRRAVAI